MSSQDVDYVFGELEQSADYTILCITNTGKSIFS